MSKAISLLLALVAASFTATTAHAQDAAAGAKKADMCIGCHGIHGYQASFPEVYKVPKIAGQGAKYIVASLTAYKKGERRHPSMRGVSGSLSDKDMADLGAYYEQLGASMIKTVADVPATQPSADVAALLTKGACSSCHGVNFSKPIDGAYPKLAGQHADYLFVALKSYKTEGHTTWGRTNGVMGGIAKQFTNAELKVLANYVASLPGELQTVPQARFK